LRALTLAVAFWRALDSRVAIIHPERHDQLLAAISHLPHLAAVSIVQSLYAKGDSTLLYRSAIGNGFRGPPRLAAGDAQLWEQIFSENREALVDNLDRWIGILQRWREMLSRGDASGEIIDALSRAADQRRSLSNSPPPPPA